jgi:hypothetical protein
MPLCQLQKIFYGKFFYCHNIVQALLLKLLIQQMY